MRISGKTWSKINDLGNLKVISHGYFIKLVCLNDSLLHVSHRHCNLKSKPFRMTFRGKGKQIGTLNKVVLTVYGTLMTVSFIPNSNTKVFCTHLALICTHLYLICHYLCWDNHNCIIEFGSSYINIKMCEQNPQKYIMTKNYLNWKLSCLNYFL